MKVGDLVKKKGASAWFSEAWRASPSSQSFGIVLGLDGRDAMKVMMFNGKTKSTFGELWEVISEGR